METKSSSDLKRSAAFCGAAIAVEPRAGTCSGAAFRAIGRNQEEAGLMTRAMTAAMAVFGPKRKFSPAVILLLIFVV
jgi:hypothetical protein